MPYSLVDTHCHLDDPGFESDRNLLIDKARMAGVQSIIVPGIAASEFSLIQNLAESNKRVHACAGLHPLFMDAHNESSFEQLQQLVVDGSIIAVGECGLDHSDKHADKLRQLDCFERQISLSIEYKLPLIIHANRAVEAVLLSVGKHDRAYGVIHSFNGSLEQAERFIALGFKLGFGGAVTYPRATRLRKLICELPLDAMVLETDAPYQSGAAHNGQRNQPAWILEVLESVAELRDESMDEIARVTTLTACNLFNLPNDQHDNTD